MNYGCDYCGGPPLWWASTENPGDPASRVSRIVCQQHVDPAREHLRQFGRIGGVNVEPLQGGTVPNAR